MSAYRDFTDHERDWQSVTMSKDSQRPTPTARKPFRQSSRSKGRQDLIGRELRRMFSDVVNEPLPDAFQDLLKQIDEEPSAGDARDDARPGTDEKRRK
jgi:hypothetical protein